MTFAILGALVIGLSLGLLGSGGSILTVPVLVFFLHRPEKIAIAESLAIIGAIAFFGALPYAFRRQIHWKSVIFLGLPGMLGSYLGAYGSFYISGTTQLTLFALVMFAVSWVMLFGSFHLDTKSPSSHSIGLIIFEGFLVGIVTGLIGVGGGFLIVPILLLFSNLSIYMAIGTSLVIIAMNAFIGFITQITALESLHLEVNEQLIGLLIVVGVLGSLSGSMLVKKISQIHLKRVFGLNVFAMGIYILIKQTPFF